VIIQRVRTDRTKLGLCGEVNRRDEMANRDNSNDENMVIVVQQSDLDYLNDDTRRKIVTAGCREK